jgi:hypothetical protein
MKTATSSTSTRFAGRPSCTEAFAEAGVKEARPSSFPPGWSVEERIAKDIDELDGNAFHADAHPDRLTVRSNEYSALKAIMLDGEVRDGYEDQDLVEYLVEIAAS